MSDRVHANVEWKQAAGCDPRLDSSPTKPEFDQLAVSHNAMLPLRKFNHLQITWAV